MQSVRQKVERAAGLNVPILILGESGTGKEILARFIHNQSPWRNGPFVKVNCPAIPGTLIESELFGFQKGAFTGAHADKPGRMETAQGGSLFLDEIAEIDASLQAKLLHVLQDGHFTRIGGHDEKRMDARVICATNRQLHKEIERGSFRADLFYRINVISITLPPLRERREDIPYLAEYLRGMFNRRFQREAVALSKETIHLLQQRDWPGNVRELENCIARYVVLGSEESFYTDRVESHSGPFHLRADARRQHPAQAHRAGSHAAHGTRCDSQGPAGQPLESPEDGAGFENQLPRSSLQGAPGRPARQAPAP